MRYAGDVVGGGDEYDGDRVVVGVPDMMVMRGCIWRPICNGYARLDVVP